MSDLLQALKDSARNEAIKLKHPYIRNEHLLLALLKQDANILPISYEELLKQLEALSSPSCGAEQKLLLAQGAKRALEQAGDDATTQMIADSILQSSPLLRRILSEIMEYDDAPTN